MAIILTKKQAKATTVTKYPDGSEDVKQEPIGEPKVQSPDEPLANVGVGKAMTINLGNYNSVKVSVDLHMPCKPDEIDETFAFADAWTNERMEKLVAEADAAKEG